VIELMGEALEENEERNEEMEDEYGAFMPEDDDYGDGQDGDEMY